MLPLITFGHMILAILFVAAFAMQPAPLAFEITLVATICASAIGHIIAFRR